MEQAHVFADGILDDILVDTVKELQRLQNLPCLTSKLFIQNQILLIFCFVGVQAGSGRRGRSCCKWHPEQLYSRECHAKITEF